MDMKTVFFFGAGAEASYKIVTGKEFVASLMRNEFLEYRKKLLKDDALNYQLIYQNSRKIFTQTIFENQESAVKVFGEQIVNDVMEYEKNRGKDVSEYCKQWYNALKNDVTDEKSQFFINNAALYSTLDSRFNDLRNPKVGPNGKRVINAYYTAYFCILSRLYNLNKVKINSYEDLFALLRTDYTLTTLNSDDSYYSLIKKHYKKDFDFVTTNYTDIIQKVLKKDQITYLHGKMTWFEDYRQLQLYDVSKEKVEECSNLIPFIMIPSGVKPIVFGKQIREFNSFIEKLDKSELLCIVGYRFNSEDNHINAIIAQWLRKDEKNKLIYLNFEDENSSRLDFRNLLWTRNLKIKKISCFDEDVLKEQIKDNNQIINIFTNRTNCLKIFEEVLKLL